MIQCGQGSGTLLQEAHLQAQNAARTAHARFAGSRLEYLRTVYRSGCALLRAGRHDEAAAAFSKALALAPDFADAAQNLGCCLAALERFEEAAGIYATVVQLRPQDAGSHFNLGCTLLAAGDHAGAIRALGAAARIAPGLAKHHHFLGQALIAASRQAEALGPIRLAASIDPANPDVLACLAGLLFDAGQTAASVEAGQQAVRLAPGHAHAQANLARALHQLGRTEEALRPAEIAAGLAPDDAGAAATLGAIQYTLALYPECVVQSRRAAGLDPDLYQAHANEALALEALGEFAAAEAASWRAIALAPPGHADTRHNLACLKLRSGQMTSEVWALYESRLHLTGESRRLAAIPRWAGEDVAGHTVLLHSEQGFGDTIQFARYAKLVQGQGARVVLAVQPALHRLLLDLPGTDAVVCAGTALPEHDVFCPLLSLPAICGTTLETVPPPLSLLPDPALLDRWRPEPAEGLQIGLVWAGSPGFIHDRARSIPLEVIAPLTRMVGVVWHSLQLPPARMGALPIIDRMAEVSDFADTAAIIAGLDLVVTVDSAVAHLAGSMGKQVWLLSRYLGCWRWLRDRDDSPWYPGLRIYRQPRPGDWSSVITEVGFDLENLLAAASA